MAIDQSQRVTSESVIRPTRDDLVAFVKTCRHVHYSPHADILFVYPSRLEPGFTVEPGDCLAYRISHDKSRVVAIELHNFKRLVLPANPQLARAWKTHTSPLRRLTLTGDRTLRFLLDKVTQKVAACDDATATVGRLAHA